MWIKNLIRWIISKTMLCLGVHRLPPVPNNSVIDRDEECQIETTESSGQAGFEKSKFFKQNETEFFKLEFKIFAHEENGKVVGYSISPSQTSTTDEGKTLGNTSAPVEKTSFIGLNAEDLLSNDNTGTKDWFAEEMDEFEDTGKLALKLFFVFGALFFIFIIIASVEEIYSN